LAYFCNVWHILKQSVAYFVFVVLATLVGFGQTCCIRRDSSRWSFFWPMMLPNISGCLMLKRCLGLANKCLQTSKRWSNLSSLNQII